MRGLDPRIHQSSQSAFSKRMDGRVKPGHDMSSWSENSHVEKHRLVVALQADVETIHRVAIARLARRNQRAAALRGHQRHHGGGGAISLALEINPGIAEQ